MQDIKSQIIVKTSWLSGLSASLSIAEYRAWVESRWRHIFILNLSLPPCSDQLSGAHANEIKHDHSPVVITVLDPNYD